MRSVECNVEKVECNVTVRQRGTRRHAAVHAERRAHYTANREHQSAPSRNPALAQSCSEEPSSEVPSPLEPSLSSGTARRDSLASDECQWSVPASVAGWVGGAEGDCRHVCDASDQARGPINPWLATGRTHRSCATVPSTICTHVGHCSKLRREGHHNTEGQKIVTQTRDTLIRFRRRCSALRIRLVRRSSSVGRGNWAALRSACTARLCVG